jgi:hypothetical protein
VAAAKPPWRSAFWEVERLPAGVRGPVDFWAFWRLAVSFFSEMVAVAVVVVTAGMVSSLCSSWGDGFLVCDHRPVPPVR